jgi:hypothetical protein
MTTFRSDGKVLNRAASRELSDLLLDLVGVEEDDITREDVGIRGVSVHGFVVDGMAGTRALVTIPLLVMVDADTSARLVELMKQAGPMTIETQSIPDFPFEQE